MRFLVRRFSWAMLLSLALAGAGPAVAQDSRALGLQIHVVPGGWGVDTRRIEPVLYAVADELVSALPGKLSAPVVVAHTQGNPVALYRRGVDGEYRVRLHASGESWPLYVYEFAHELCHVLSNHDLHAQTRKHNQWFEETLCETASLYALQAVAQRWDMAAESSRAAAAPRLRRFYDVLLAERTRELPAGTPLSRWLAEHEAALRGNPYLREKNDLVAKHLLPFFQQDGRRWRALAYLNLHCDDATATLADYLGHWNDNAPAEHRGFIADMRAFVVPPATTQVAAAGDVAVPVTAAGTGSASAQASAGPVRERPPVSPDVPPPPGAKAPTRSAN